MTDLLRRTFDAAVGAGYERAFIRGKMGRLNADGSVSMAVPDRGGFVYVTLTGDGNQTVDIALNPYAARLINLPVKMKRVNGVLVIKEIDDSPGALETYLGGGTGAAVGPHTHRSGSGLEYEAETFWLDAGRVLWSGSGLTVRIRPLHYRHNGASVYFPGGTLDLMSNLPATLDQWAWIVVGIDPATNAAVAVTGAEAASQGALTESLIAGVNMLDYIPLGAVQAQNGDTSLSARSRYADARQWTNVPGASDVAAAIYAAAAKTTPVDADTVGIVDSEAANVLKKLSWANIKATLKTYFDTLYNLYVHPNHLGDVTSVGDGATTIAADAVTNTKAANMAQSTIKGRAAGAGTGDPTDLTATQVRTIVNVADGANAYVHPNHSGDVTSVGDGATTIANDAVTTAKILNNAATLAKIQQIQTQMLLGRNTAAAGNVEELAALPTNIDALYALLAGRAGGQTLNGGNATGNNLILNSTAHATKGEVKIANDGGNVTVRRTSAAGHTVHIGQSGSGLQPELVLESTGGRKLAMKALDSGLFPVMGTETDSSYSLIQNNQQRMRFAGGANAGRLGIFGLGVAEFNPQGGIHFHDGTTGYLLHTISVPSGTSVTVIPDGTGDVTVALNCEFALKPSTGAGLSGSRVNVQPGGGDQSLWDTGTDILVIRVTSGGAIQVQRTAGTLTYTVSLRLFWQ